MSRMKGTAQRTTAPPARRTGHLAALTLALLSSSTSIIGSGAPSPRAVDAFAPPPIGTSSSPIVRHRIDIGRRSHQIVTPASSSSSEEEEEVEEETSLVRRSPAEMKSRDIQSELGVMGISYSDCFDRDSLVRRLIEARDGSITSAPVGGPSSSREAEWEGGAGSDSATSPDIDPAPTTTEASFESVGTDATNAVDATSSTGTFDRETTLAELRNLRVRELRVRLSDMRVRWGTMIEKEDMVRALCDAMEERYVRGMNYSRTGTLIPGTVSDVDEDALMKELGWSEMDVVGGGRGVDTTAPADDVVASPVASSPPPSDERPPLLLDVYATWCGPCQFMAPHLAKAAEEFGRDVRVVKLDSDKYPRISGALKVGGLPTLIRFDGGNVSKEIQRVEGALTKDQIKDFVNGDFRR